MRKKITMLLAALFLVMGTAWAQVPYTVNANTGTGVNTSGWSNTWTATSNPATLKLLCTAGNMQAESDGLLSMYVGKSSPSTYTLQVANTHKILSYSFKFKRDGSYAENENVTLKVNGSDYTPTEEEQLVEVKNVNATSTTFQMAGSNKGIIASEFVVNVERVFESGYYTIQCNGNNKFANYNGGERIVPMDMGRFPTSVYLFTKGDNGMYTIQTSDKKFVTYKGTGTGDQVAIVDAASANDNNKWWVINETSAEVFTIVPKQDNIVNNTPGWNYSVSVNGVANAALGFWGRDGGNSKWLIKAAPIMTSGTAKIKCAGTYVTLGSEATLFTKGNADNACQFTVLAGEEGKYTIQLADGRFVTHKSSNNGDQIEIVEAGSATEENKWWVIAPNVTGEKSTGNEVDIIPARGNIGRTTAAWNWAVTVSGVVNSAVGLWNASGDGSRCTIEWTPTTLTYRYSYNGEVKRTEQVQGFAGYPYPAPTLSVFGVVPTPLAGDIAAGEDGKIFDMEYSIDLPFRFADSYDDIEHWYFMKIRDDGFTYMGYDAEKSYIRANQSNVPVDSKDAYTWGFVGNPFDGFSIVNYATGKTKVLSAPVAPTGNGNAGELARMVEVTNEYTGNLVWNFKAPTHPNPKPGVFYIEHPTAINYAFNRQGFDGANALCYWTGRDTGSAIQVVERGVFNLSDLTNEYIYALQAERSPLMYSKTEGMTTKLSSGLVDDIAADASNINQQFLIMKDKDASEYYLYSLGAQRFVDANLNFTECPEPVLSFEENTNNSHYPWYVKINDKYVVPGHGGQAGNKLFHTSTPDEDDGKRYRIVKVEEADPFLLMNVGITIEASKSLIRNIEDLDNEKVYTVTTFDRGKWHYYGDEALWSTGKNQGTKPDPTDQDAVEVAEKADKFAFLTVNNKTYLYSVGAGKFVVKSETDGSKAHANMYYATYSDRPAHDISFLPATNGSWFPVVVKFNVDGPNQLNVSNSFSYPIIMWDDQADPGNQVRIEEAGNTYDLSSVIETIENYQSQEEALNEYLSWFKASYFDQWASAAYKWRDQSGVNNYTISSNGALTLEEYYNNAKRVLDNPSSTIEALNEQKNILESVVSLLEINQPEADKFYRLRCVGGQMYVSADISNDRFEMQGQNYSNPAHMFMYDGTALLSYSQGLYMNHQNFNAVGTKSTVAFTEAANGVKGQYNIKVGTRYVYGRGNTQNNHIDSGTGSPTNATENGYNWWLEEVTSLPVTVSAVGYATLYAPVALEIPTDVIAYVGVQVDNYLDLTDIKEVTGGNVIPANTGVILEAKQGTYNFAVADDVAALDKSKNLLTGKYPKSEKNASAKVYTLQNGSNGVGLYLFNGYRDENDKEGTKTYINGFRAWVELPADAKATALRIRRAGTTEIEETLADGEQEMVIYDLAGRRIEKIVEKGIYIVNGKKVVIR